MKYRITHKNVGAAMVMKKGFNQKSKIIIHIPSYKNISIKTGIDVKSFK